MAQTSQRRNMKTWQIAPNVLHYTNEELHCSFCGKQIKCVIEMENHYACNKCFCEEVYNTLFGNDKNYVRIRLIEDISFDKRKNVIKKERGMLTPKLRYTILKRDKFKCVLCGATGKENKLEIDHIIPISKGGKTIKSNLRILCFNCNRGKGNEKPTKRERTYRHC